MGLLDGLLGNASEIDRDAIDRRLAGVLIDGERVEHAFRLVRDLIVFTNLRLLLIDKQGLSGKKQETLTIPFGSITRFSKENKGRFDRDAEIKVWVRGESVPLELTFRDDKSIDDVYRVLSRAVLA